MSANVDMINPNKPKRILMIAANAAISTTTGWPIGFWWAELTHPYWEFKEQGYEVEIVSPKGGDLQGDGFSDPRDANGYSAYDLISLGFINSSKHMSLLKNTKSISEISPEHYDAIFIVGGQSPMFTMVGDQDLHQFVADFYESGKMVTIVCHGTCILLKVKLSDGMLLVNGKTWTGFANAEEEFADNYAGQKIQPFWIEEEAKKNPHTNFIVNGRFKPYAVRDGRLITGQQQFSGKAASRLLIEALGV